MITIPDGEAQTAKFDRVLAALEGLPDVKSTKPTTILDVTPMVGDTVTYVVQTKRSKESGFMIFLQVVDAEGRARFVVPPKVANAIYRQRQSLTDRSTPASREAQRKKRENAKRKKEREARRERARKASQNRQV